MNGRRVGTTPYGSWRSPISAQSLTEASLRISEVHVDGDDIFWLEGRAAEHGRTVLVQRAADGVCRDLTPAPFNVRSRVHEYGGGAWTVCDGTVIFSNFDDQRLYRLDLGHEAAAEPAIPKPITVAAAHRFADIHFDAQRREVVCVREDHTTVGAEPVNTLVRLDLDSPNTDGGTVLISGSDFVSSPTISPDGAMLAWLRWNHPNMPWDGTELVVGSLDGLDGPGSLGEERVIAGGPSESILQPRWASDGRLFFLSDRTGWWNFYTLDLGVPGDVPREVLPMPREFATPPWMLGMSSYDFLPNNRVLCSWVDGGVGGLGVLDLTRRELTPVETSAIGFGAVRAAGDVAVLTASYADQPDAVLRITTHDGEVEVLRRASGVELDAAFVSVAEPVTWRNRGGEAVHGFFYAPVNPNVSAPTHRLPPLLVLSHGGPTSMTTATFDPGVQYWTTRGFAVLDVNYGGSSGYGRPYRERLRGQWGIVDVDDCVSGAIALGEAARIDRARTAIRGASAGGYTTLAALTFRDTFAAGASYFGVSDLEALARDTHKFESHYSDGLVGPYPADKDVYVERSPLHHVARLDCPIILLQGADDEVVPPAQARLMADAVRARGLPVALVMFAGEGHGFRKAENMRRAIEAEAYFYSRVFDFTLADAVEPVEIDNLP